MTPAERKAVWRRLEKEYKPHLDYTGNAFLEEGGYWQRQHHIYSLPFYYIDYCIAQSCALQYKTRMDEDYKEVGLKNPLEDVAWKMWLRKWKRNFSYSLILGVGSGGAV